ncbi:hypothetical protein [Pseudovibrio sp. Tun.PSC04-5.I4]|uniref:hypothetical protein n=1 Tax=Pseudovibrio sp. Tun.PSC04-5.I4 TaxID=1798213 RepID=UPI001FCC5AEF|nr:hypothetical protein [Pseudovibrio sp. Tun.PSC04-5.I4]
MRTAKNGQIINEANRTQKVPNSKIFASFGRSRNWEKNDARVLLSNISKYDPNLMLAAVGWAQAIE